MMNWLEFWDWLTECNCKKTPEPQEVTVVPAVIIQPDRGALIVRTDPIKLSDGRILPPKTLAVPQGKLNNSRPGDRVLLEKTGGEYRNTTRVKPHHRQYRPNSAPTGVPAIQAFQGPQRFEYLYKPTLNRTSLTLPYFGAVNVAGGDRAYSDDSPRFGEPLDDLGVRHPHNLYFGGGQAWRHINHQTRKATMPNYMTSSYSIGIPVPDELGVKQFDLATEDNKPYLPPPFGTRSLGEYQAGYPKILAAVGDRDAAAYFNLSAPIGAATQGFTVTSQGQQLDYSTGEVTEISSTQTSVLSEWRGAEVFMETWEYYDPITVEPRRIIKYRSAPTQLRVVMMYEATFNGEIFVPQATHARWEGLDASTGQWWPIHNTAVFGDLTTGSLNLVPAGLVDVPEEEWLDPIPPCAPTTGAFPAGRERRGPNWPNSVLVGYPTGSTYPPPDPQMDFGPGFTSPDLEGEFTANGIDTLFGYGEHFVAADVKVNGEHIPGEFSYWTAMRHKQPFQEDKQTLLLCGDDGITVLLDLGEAKVFEWGEFWLSLGQPEGLQFLCAGSPYAHHSFPQERAFIGVQLGGQGYVMVLDHLNPWRDLSQQQWKQQGMAKPKTWAKYLQHLQDGKGTPSNETGLVVAGVIPMAIPNASKPGYMGGVEPLPFKALPFRSLPLPRGERQHRTAETVEVLGFTGTSEQKSKLEQNALTVLQKTADLEGWDAAYPTDKPAFGKGVYRITFNPIPVGGETRIQLVGRAKGNLGSLQTEDGQTITADWLGYGLNAKQEGKAVPARGWRPFSAVLDQTVVPQDGLTLTLNIKSGLQISQLIWAVTAVQ